MKSGIYILGPVAALALLILFTNCAKLSSDMGLNSSSTVSEADICRFAPIDCLKTPKPALLCGPEGYEYLIREYIGPQCAACHNETSFFTRFPLGHSDPFTAYQVAIGFSKEEWAREVTENQYCGDCNINPEGETYGALMEWLDNVRCPE